MKRVLAIISVAGIVLAACGGSKGGAIKIGVGGAHSGDLASYGLPTVKAAELVVAAVNEKGGINGRKIELVVEDDQCKPEVAHEHGVQAG
jgi:branched-chain amino acid transport system substrate-binding protein